MDAARLKQLDLRPMGHYNALGYQSSARLSSIDGITAAQNFSGDAHANVSRDRAVAMSRKLYRDNPIYRGIINRAVSYIVGKGFALQSRSPDPEWNQKTESLWREYWKAPEVRGSYSGKRYERLVMCEILTGGDVFPAFVKAPNDPRGTTVQLFESEQCAAITPNADNGVFLDEYGRPSEYNLVGYAKTSGYAERAKKNLWSAAEVMHLFDPERASSSRGMPALESAFPMLHRINDVCDAEAIARQMLAHLALSVTREEARATAYGESEADTTNNDADKFRIQELDYATIFHCEPGQSIKGIDRNIPGTDFEKSMTLFLRVLGLPLGLPLEIIMLDWTKSNYSQSRAVLQQAFQTFSDWQDLLKERHLTRIYMRKVMEWVRMGHLQPVQGMGRHEWIAPNFPWIDEEKEIKAQGKKIELGITSHAEVCKMSQHDRAEVIEEREGEVRDAIKRANQIKADTGVDVPWQIFAGLPLPGAHLFTTEQTSEDTENDTG